MPVDNSRRQGTKMGRENRESERRLFAGEYEYALAFARMPSMCFALGNSWNKSDVFNEEPPRLIALIVPDKRSRASDRWRENF
jgi:hypothetical protein